MIYKRILITDIINVIKDDLIDIYGNVDNQIVTNIPDVTRVNEGSLDWIGSSKKEKQSIAEKSSAKVILVDEGVEYSKNIREQKKILLVVKKPKQTLIKVISSFFVEKFQTEIHESAYIHPKAHIGDNVYIGPNCYIGNCIIGNNNVIHSNVSIYDRTIIGNNNVIHSGALICVDGLGCVRQPDGTLKEFPQIGGVVIGDNCYIGGNTHIASGSLSDTIISDGCKINGMSFIGSNDILHENVWITGSTMLAGSVEVGSNTTIFSRVIVRDWCKIGERVTIGMGSVVTKNVPDGETWLGSPARKFEKI